MTKDYYKILGCDKYVTQDEIKKLYKKLALKYHPDKNNDDEECKNKFQEITEAYSILSNEEKRKKYDMFGLEDNDFHFDEDPFKVFNNIFHEHIKQFKNMHYENNFDFGNIINELSGIDFNNLFDLPKVHVKVHSIGKNKNLNNYNFIDDIKNMKFHEKNNLVEEIIDDIVIHIDVHLSEVYNLKKRNITYEKNKYKKGKIIKKKISLDVNLFDKEIILKNNGNETENKKGDVCICIHYQDKDFIRINEYDIFHEIKIKFKDYYQKKNFEIKLPNENILYLKNIKGNKIIKIFEKGIPYIIEDKTYYGNLYCYFSIEMPEINDMFDIANELIEDNEDISDIISDNEFTEYKYVNSNEVFNID